MQTEARWRRTEEQTLVVGTTSDYSLAWTWPVTQGSDLTEQDVKGLRKVGLIGQYLATRLFGEENPVGKTILVRSLPVQIVGVLSSRGMTPTGLNMDDRLVMPISTVMHRMQNETRYVATLRVRFTDMNHLKYYQDELKSFLRQRHGMRDGESDDFRIISPKEIIKFLVAVTGSLVVFVGIVGVISLVVAGFILANLFLLSVKERTAEIGIRRSVGAKKRDIQYTITVSGGSGDHHHTRRCYGLRHRRGSLEAAHHRG